MNQLNRVLYAVSLGIIAAMVILYLPYLLAGALVAVAVLLLLGLIAWFWFRHKIKNLSRQFEEQLKHDLGGMADMGGMGGFQRAKGLDGSAPFDQNNWGQNNWPGEEPVREPRSGKNAGTGPIIHIKPEEIN